ncbi:MAG: ComF family protein [bacterium]
MSLVHGFLDLVFPPACQVCRSPGTFPLCTACRYGFRLVRPPICQKCGKPLRGPDDLEFTCIPCRHRKLHFVAARAAGIYDGTLREAIHALKFRGRRGLAAPLGSLMAERIAGARLPLAQVVIPVPLHRRRLRERGYNQSELLAAEIANRFGLLVRSDVLVRRQATEAQSGLTLDDRRANVRGAFFAACSIDGQTVLLVDDVLSTGFTASECARALRQAGAAQVVVLTVAIAVLD